MNRISSIVLTFVFIALRKRKLSPPFFDTGSFGSLTSSSFFVHSDAVCFGRALIVPVERIWMIGLKEVISRTVKKRMMIL